MHPARMSVPVQRTEGEQTTKGTEDDKRAEAGADPGAPSVGSVVGVLPVPRGRGALLPGDAGDSALKALAVSSRSSSKLSKAR